LAGNFDKVSAASKKAIGFVAEKLGIDPAAAKYAYDETVNKASQAMDWVGEKTGLTPKSENQAKGSGKLRMMDVYQSFREHGMSDKQSKALTAQNVFDRGFFFKVIPATSAERAQRKATALYAYTTGGSIQTLKIDSYLVQ